MGWGRQGAPTRFRDFRYGFRVGAPGGARFMDFRLEIKLSEAQKHILEHPKIKTLVDRYTFLGSIFDMEQ